MSLCLAALVLALTSNAFAAGRLTLNFNPDWKFIKTDVPEAAQPRFDDHGWTSVSAPHTFNDIDTFDDWSLSGHRGEQNQWGGRTWYRKTFVAPESFKGRKVYLEFEAVRQVAEIYLNGKLLGVSKTGFTPFGFDLTPHLRFDAPNVLAVMCDNRFMKDPPVSEGALENGRQNKSKKSRGKKGSDLNINPAPGQLLSDLSAKVNAGIPEDVNQITADQLPWNNPHWHPAHGGIFRNVFIHVTDPLHISLPLYSFLQTAGPYAYASEISGQSAKLNLQVPIQNARSSGEQIELTAQVLDHGGKSVLSLKTTGQIAAGAQAEFTLSGLLENPRFWEPDYPHLYRVVCSLRVGSETIDSCEIPCGIRTARWDAQTGLNLNGHPIKLHGWGQKPTDEWPGLGAAQPDWTHFFTLRLMKEAGGNFVRWGHCAGPPVSIAAADRLGLITDQPGVDGESDTRGAAWTIRAAAFRDTIIYYRNHPSILLWEGGNQKVSRDHARQLRDLIDKYDPHGGRAYTHRRTDESTAQFLDVGLGTEGGREIARLPVVEGEYDREESPRRVWDDFSPPHFGYPEAKDQTFDLTSEQYAVNQVAQYVRKLGAADHCGGANWIFSDSTSGGRVTCEVARAGGEVDGSRLPKEAYYVCRAMFRADPQVHIIGHWTYPPRTKKPIYVASNCEAVELFVNGKSLGRGKVSDHYLFTFPEVAWQPGEIRAIASVGGKSVATQVKHTAGPPVALRLTPITGPGGWRADGSDVALMDVEAVDASGERCPTFQKRVDFDIDGPGIWRGGYNSGKTNSINLTRLDLECGLNRVSVRATRTPGAVIVRARCENLKPGTITLQSVPVKIDNGISAELPLLPDVALPEQRIEVTARRILPVPPPATFSLSPSEGERGPFAPAPPVSEPQSATEPGRFTKAFSYSGPSASVRVQQDAQDGKKIYADRDFQFVSLPQELRGSDYVQAARADTLYHAVDLMEIALKAGTILSVAHDDRLPRPAWLTSQSRATDLSLTINGQPMRIFQRPIEHAESLTLGPNTESAKSEPCNMYIVFVNAASRPRAAGPAPKEHGP